MIPFAFHPEAETEFDDAALFYESRVQGLRRSFWTEVHRVISLIREYPDEGTPIRLPIRRDLVRRFPYAIVYRHDDQRVAILAVAHSRRRPGYWRRRT